MRPRRSGPSSQLRTRAEDVRASPVQPETTPSAQEGLLRLGMTSSWHDDLYHRALTTSWPRFLLLTALGFLLINAAFAVLYLLQPGAVAGARAGDFADHFFFSVETVATVGYGQMYPVTRYANLLMTAEVLLGLLITAMTTGLAFARFSRPTARVLFSRSAVIGPHDGQPMLAVRLANARRNRVLEAQVTLALLRDEMTAEGRFIRRFYDLKLARGRTPVFAMTFLVLHPIDSSSPLFGATPESLQAGQAELVLNLTGLDETLSQTVHARAAYRAGDILFNRRFADIIGVTPDGRRAIDFAQFHDTVAVEQPGGR